MPKIMKVMRNFSEIRPNHCLTDQAHFYVTNTALFSWGMMGSNLISSVDVWGQTMAKGLHFGLLRTSKMNIN